MFKIQKPKDFSLGFYFDYTVSYGWGVTDNKIYYIYFKKSNLYKLFLAFTF